MSPELEEPSILLQEKKASNIRELRSALEGVAQSGRPPLIAAEDTAGEALATPQMPPSRHLLRDRQRAQHEISRQSAL